MVITLDHHLDDELNNEVKTIPVTNLEQHIEDGCIFSNDEKKIVKFIEKSPAGNFLFSDNYKYNEIGKAMAFGLVCSTLEILINE